MGGIPILQAEAESGFQVTSPVQWVRGKPTASDRGGTVPSGNTCSEIAARGVNGASREAHKDSERLGGLEGGC